MSFWTKKAAKPALLVGVAASAMMSFPAFAQREGAETDEIVVRGEFSRSLSNSLDEKRDAVSIVDAIVAADIGKLPAVNVAEALQRVPGVTIVREAGEGQFISVRGLGPNFQAVTLNGMPLAYNENIRTSGQSGRQFRFRVLPADLIDGVVVVKSPTADLTEGGIGSTVDIKTVNPLDRDAFIAARAYASYEGRTDKVTPNGSISAGWKNADNTFGVIGGFSYQQREVQFDRLQTGWGEREIAGLGVVSTTGDVQTTLEQEKRDRMSAVGGLQWRPAPNLEFDVDVLYSKFNNEIAERRVTFQMADYWDNLNLDTAVVENGRVIAGVIEGARIRNTTEFSDQAHENVNLNASVKYELGGWTFEPGFSFSRATSDLDTPLQRIEYRTDAGVGALTFDHGDDAVENSAIDALFIDLDLTDPSTVPFRRYRVRSMNSEDQDITAVFDISRELDAEFAGLTLAQVKLGAQYSDRFRDYQRRDRSGTALRDGLELTDGFNSTLVPENAFDQSIGQGQLWTSADWDLFRESYVIDGEYDGVEPSADELAPTAADLSNSYGVDEEIWAAYVRFDFESQFGDIPFTGNVGLRYVTTDSSVDGTLVTAETDPETGDTVTTRVPRTTPNAYDEFLPSLNLNFDVTENVIVRLAAARTMTRPSLSELRDVVVPNSSTVSDIFDLGAAAFDETLILTATAGNPNLDPYTAWNVDLSFEWYFERFGAFTASAFYKDLNNYISTDFQLRTVPFAVNDGSTLPVELLVSSPANIGDVSISGLEFGYTNQLEMGLGVSASATFATSKLTLNTSDVGVQTAGIQGISDFSYTVSPFFEKGPFEAHVSYTYRDDFLTDGGVTVTSRPTREDAVPFYQKGFGTLDMGASFDITENIDVFFQGVNMLNVRPATYVGTEEQFHQIHTYGRTLNFGVRARF